MQVQPVITQPTYYKQIDFLRAVAVMMVIFSHWAGYHGNLWQDDSLWFNGEVGVQLFFVISGFLITGILLDERNKAEQSGDTVRPVLRAFYVRRFLRIFPLYYATLFLGYAFGHPDVRLSIQWQITYLSNFFFAARGEYMGDVSHFWSLAVEEQFYLIWPWIVLFIPKRYFLHFLLASVCMGPVFRFSLAYIFGANEVAINVLPFSCLDSLAGGGLLALLQRRSVDDKQSGRLLRSLIKAGILCGILYILLRTVIPIPQGWESHGLFACRVLLVPALYAIVFTFARGIRGQVGRLVESGPIAYIGKISYGIYVFHFFIPGITAWMCYQLDFLIWERISMEAYVLFNLVVLVAVSAFSWHVFEKPINGLKRYFAYNRVAHPSAPRLAWLLNPYMKLISRRDQ